MGLTELKLWRAGLMALTNLWPAQRPFHFCQQLYTYILYIYIIYTFQFGNFSTKSKLIYYKSVLPFNVACIQLFNE